MIGHDGSCRVADDGVAHQRWDEITAPCASFPAMPFPPQGTQIEGRGQQAPLGGHVVEAPQQEPPCPLLLLDDPEDRLYQPLPAMVQPSGFIAAHPGPMTAQRCVVRPYLKPSPMSSVPRTHPKGRTPSADGSRGPVEAHRYPPCPLDTGEPQTLSLRTDVAVGLLIVGESVLVLGAAQRPTLCLGHHNFLLSEPTLLEVAP